MLRPIHIEPQVRILWHPAPGTWHLVNRSRTPNPLRCWDPATQTQNPTALARDRMKTTHAAILLFAIPTVLVAQGGAPQANPITAALKARTLTYQRFVAQALDSIPESKYGYKPTPVQLTVGYVAQHLAEDNYFYCNNFGTMKANVSTEESTTADTVKAKWPKAKLMSNLKASLTFCENALNQLDDAKLAETFERKQGEQTVQVPRVNPVIGHVIDLVDHYSQLANYMRLNNLIPPTALPRPRPAGN